MTDPKDDFNAWYNEHYDLDQIVRLPGANGRDLLLPRCRRCGGPVGWPTKHAVERHGDPIEVIDAQPDTDPAVLAAY